MVDRLVNSEVNDRRIANVEACFGKSGKPLRMPGRVLVGEGVLIKICRKEPKQRQFFLFNDILVYGTIMINKKRYNKQHIIPLENVKLQDLEDDGRMKNGWIIRTPTKSFSVYAATAVEKKEWTMHIERCVSDLLASGNKQAAKEHAAVWVPDSEAARCMACGRTQFNLVQRRHHCRSCGAVVCGACSSHSYRIETLSKRPVRVCDPCFNRLTGVDGHSNNPNVGPPSADLRPTNASDSSGESDHETDVGNTRPVFYPE